MKVTILTFLAVALGSHLVQAADLFCGANVEQVAESGNYDRLVFWEKAEPTKLVIRYVLADGSVLKSDKMTIEDHKKIIDGTLVIWISSNDGRPSLVSGKVKREINGNIKFTNMALASTFNGNSPMLLANGAMIMCKEL